jgi:hypothetical protein
MSVPFVVYDANGNVLRSGRCQDHMVEAQARPFSGEVAVAEILKLVAQPDDKGRLVRKDWDQFKAQVEQQRPEKFPTD